MYAKAVLRIIRGIFFALAFVLIIILGVSLDIWGQYDPFSRLLLSGTSQRITDFLSGSSLTAAQAERIFQAGHYVLAGKEDEIGVLSDKYRTGMEAQQIMGSHIHALAEGNILEESVPVPQQKVPLNHSAHSAPVIPIFKEYKAYLYCTHSAESYIPDSGEARLEGKLGLVNQVAARLAKEMSTRGLTSEFISTMHDYPEYNKSYTKSRETVKNIIKRQEKIAILLDIHRDSIPGIQYSSTVKVKDKTCAPVLIIVGTDERKPHPHWKENYHLACCIYNEAQKKYPGLVKGVRIKAGTYNQEYHPRALLLEFGSDYNRLEEVMNSCEYMAEIILAVLEEELSS
ncbi:MAG TPA: hypothetical protein GX404_05610 [Syntrophomonadaceae bacterium]|jgi:stage II sporulation protein P|nr:hypothetical protein [Syntrophomonadaceae bacterium]